MKTKILLSSLLTVSLAAGSLQAASNSSEWNLFTSGTHSWSLNGNWTTSTWVSSAWNPTTSAAPQNGVDNFAAQIRNSGINDITVETAGNVTVSRLWLERTGTGSTTLKLGGNMTVTGALTGPPASGENSRPTGIYNSVAGEASKLVVDLNGHTLDAGNATGNNLPTARNYTIRDTSESGDGTFIMTSSGNGAGLITGTVYVEDRVTVKMTAYGGGFQDGSGSLTNVGWSFAQNATLWLSATGGNGTVVNLNVGGSIFGNLIVGGGGSALAAVQSLGHSSGTNLLVEGDLTYLNGSVISMNNSAGGPVNRKITLRGNLTDEATTGADYGGRVDRVTSGFHFVGGADREQQVLVKRQGLTTRFFVGDSETEVGNVALLHGLTTTGPVDVATFSRIDVNTFTLQAGSVNIANDAKVAFTFGNAVEDARIVATGQLALETFDLELTYDNSGWDDGADLLLFQFGSLSGTPTLGDVTLAGFTYGDLWNDGAGGIWLRDLVAVPEPGTISTLLMGGAAMLLGACLRRRRQGASGE